MILASVTLKNIKNNQRVGMVYMVAENLDKGIQDVISEFCKVNKIDNKLIRPLSISILANTEYGEEDRQLVISK